MAHEARLAPETETTGERLDRLGIYGEIKRELIRRGIPAEEIAFIHDFETPAKKAQAFADVNAGRIRILLASTEKAGTGVNMQERLFALHHLDAPWRPSDVEQREGRILRQGNHYHEIRIFNYVTENSFDGYMWQTLENKARFIAQIMTGEVTARTMEDMDDLVITAAQVKAIASGNPRILERVSVEVELARLSRLYTVWRKSRRHLQWEAEAMPGRLREADERVAAHQQALATREPLKENGENFTMRLRRSLEAEEEVMFTERLAAGEQLDRLRQQARAQAGAESHRLGSYRGFQLLAQKQRDRHDSLFAPVEGWFTVPNGTFLYQFKFGESAAGTLQSIDAQMRGLDSHWQRAAQAQSELRHQQSQLVLELGKGWEYAPAYQQLQARLEVVNLALQADGSEPGEPPAFAALGADTWRACEPVATPPTRQLAASAEATESAPPAFVAPADSPRMTTSPDVPTLAPEPLRITLEELRRQARPSSSRKSSRQESAAQLSLWS